MTWRTDLKEHLSFSGMEGDVGRFYTTTNPEQLEITNQKNQSFRLALKTDHLNASRPTSHPISSHLIRVSKKRKEKSQRPEESL